MHRQLLGLAVPAAMLLAGAAAATPPPQWIAAGDAGAAIAWLRTFSSDGDDWINDLVPIGQGQIAAVGFLGRDDAAQAPDWRALLAVLDAGGEVRLQREYGAGDGIDAFWIAGRAAGGELVLAGFTTRIGAGGIDGWVASVDEAGNLLGEASFGGAGYDRFTDFAAAADGYLFVGHSQRAGEDRRRIFLVRTDARLQPLWERIIEGEGSLGALYVEAADNGEFVVAGGASDGRQSDMFAIRFDAGGREIWRRLVGSDEADDVNHGLVLLPGGHIVLLGYSRSWGARENDILAVTLSGDGDVVRREMIGGDDDDRPILAAADVEGRVWIVGHTRSAGAGGSDLLLARLEADGAFAPGVVTLGGPGDDNGTAVRPIGGGSVMVAGYTVGPGEHGQDAFVARLDGLSLAETHPAMARRTLP